MHTFTWEKPEGATPIPKVRLSGLHPGVQYNTYCSVEEELREPCTNADAHAAQRMVTQSLLPVQRYCIRATSSCNAPARVASLGDEILDGSTEAQKSRSE
jgi:hypothetical protein